MLCRPYTFAVLLAGIAQCCLEPRSGHTLADPAPCLIPPDLTGDVMCVINMTSDAASKAKLSLQLLKTITPMVNIHTPPKLPYADFQHTCFVAFWAALLGLKTVYNPGAGW